MSETSVAGDTIGLTYDRVQHCAVVRERNGSRLAIDGCSGSGGKGEDFSPVNLVGSGLAACMLLSMGVLARRERLDLTGARVDVDVAMGEKRIDAVDLRFTMPSNFAPAERVRLEKAAGMCPIKPSLHPDIPISVRFSYPE